MPPSALEAVASPDLIPVLRAAIQRTAQDKRLPLPRSYLFSRSAAPLVRVSVPATQQADPSLPTDPSAAYESLLASDPARRLRGSFYTPAPIVNRLLDLTLDPILRAARTPAAIRALRICDPACGAGNFLLVAFDRIAAALARASKRKSPSLADRRAALACIRGCDIDPIAAELCRISLWLRVADPNLPLPKPSIRTTDSLLATWPRLFPDILPAGFDLVIGNPPFLNQLESSTAHAPTRTAALKKVFGDSIRPYTDPAALFLLLSARLTHPGGHVCLIEPTSILASRDAAPIRAALTPHLDGLWISGAQVFDASVRVCAPILRIGHRTTRIRLWSGPDFEPLPDAAPPSPESWAPLAAIGIPDIPIASARTLADLATATADFRDQYYGLRGHVLEDASLNGADRRRFPPLITTGLIEPARCLWSKTPTRFDRQPFTAPRVNLGALAPNLKPWAAARLVPKILLATQTRILEAAIDDRGHWLPAVPVITITPKDPADLWLLAAAILSPLASAWALRNFGGAGLSHDAVKLSAKQALQIPLPTKSAPWKRAAIEIRLAATSDETAAPAHLLRAAELTCHAYAIPDSQAESLISWWRSRAKW